MELNVYSVLDLKVQAFSQPYYARTRGEAIRTFGSAVNDGGRDNMWAKYPSDYELYEIGSWDDQTGEITHCRKQNLGLALQYKTPEDQDTPRTRESSPVEARLS